MRSGGRYAARTLVAASVVGICAAIPAPGRAAQLSVDAPQSCLDRETLAEEVGNLIGKPIGAIGDLDFRVEITERPKGGWRLRLTAVNAHPANGHTAEVRGSREIDGATCAELAEAAAVAISVSLRSSADETARAAPHSAATPSPTVAPAASAAPVLAQPAPPRMSWRPAIALAFATDTGALPQTGFGVDLEGHLQGGAIDIALLATGFGSDDTSGATSAGGRFRLLLGGVLGCWGPHWGRWTTLACAGGEIGRLSGTGTGVARPETGDALWRAARGDLGVSAGFARNLALLVRGGLVVPLARPAFVLDQSQLVHRPGPLTVRLTLGAQLAF